MADRSQSKHESCKRVVTQLRQPLITTWACVTETMYLALKRGGWPLQAQVSRYLMDDLVTVYDISRDDYGRLFGLMEQYRDRPMDLADATLVVTAEKLGEHRILTFDSDFLFYRISDRDSFNVIQV
jgi:uncharacterized protein